MTNPNNAVGTNAAYSGRTSPNALNDILTSFTKGIVSGWECSPKTGMTIQIGGTANTRDVALAEDNSGNKLTINNRSGAPIEITLSGAPSTNNRIDAIVAYVDNPSTGDGNTTDNPTTCGIIAVSGSVAANPTAPTEATIRAAITTDGATGGSAYYVILATILVGTNVTTIGSGVITQGAQVVTLGTASQALNGLNDLIQKFNLSDTVTTAQIAITRGSISKLPKLAQNSDGSVFKFYGPLQINAFSSTNGAALPLTQVPGLSASQKGLATNCFLAKRPSSAIIIDGAFFMARIVQADNNVTTASVGPIAIGTDGQIYIDPTNSGTSWSIDSGYFLRFYFPPCVYFNENFGD